MKCYKIDYKYLQEPNDPSFCISCCNEIFQFERLANKNILSMMIENPNSTTIKNNDVDASNANSTSLVFNQFNNFSPEQKNEPENTVNSNYYGIDQFQTLKFHEKISQYPYFI